MGSNTVVDLAFMAIAGCLPLVGMAALAVAYLTLTRNQS